MQSLVPIPKVEITIRVATMADLPFLDALQKKYNRALGFFPRAQMEGYIRIGAVLIAESGRTEPPHPGPLPGGEGVRIGYIISKDRYLKRDELGVIFQLCVNPDTQRKLVGAALVQAAFDRSAYGCRLYCCWCAQDLAANYFWESLGFVPIAFRAGSSGKKRVHIFWQKKIVDGDTETKWWYPSQTSSGAIREDRLVFPIPPGVHWKDVEAMALPIANRQLPIEKPKALPTSERKSAIGNRKSEIPTAPPPGKVGIVVGGRIRYVDRPGYVPPVEPAKKRPRPQARPPREKAKADPKLLGAARELRDRYLEHINTPGNDLLPCGKYEIARLPARAAGDEARRALPLMAPQAA